MKKIIILLLGFVLALAAQEILTKTLPNGMEVAVKKNTSNTSVGFFCFVKTGSIHEAEYSGKGLHTTSNTLFPEVPQRIIRKSGTLTKERKSEQ